MARPLDDFDPIDPITPSDDDPGLFDFGGDEDPFGDPPDGEDPEGGHTPSTVPIDQDLSDFKVDIPDWLKRFSQEGFGAEFMRGALQLGGTPLASQANARQRQLAANPFLRGASGSGFAQKRIESLGVEKSKQLSSLQLGVESKNQAVQLKALARLRELERFNEQVEGDFANMSEIERLQMLQRKFELESGIKTFQADNPGGLDQLAGFAGQILPFALL